MIQVAKARKLQSTFYSARFIFPCPYSVCMYKIMIRNQLANFHDRTVETGLRVCSNGHAPLTVMPIYGKIMIKKTTTLPSSSKPRNAQIMILSFIVAMTGLEKCCITSAVAISLR